MKKENPLKKHHFWLLLGFAPLLTLLGAMMISSGVGGAIEAQQSELKKANDALSSKLNPKSKETIRKASQAVAVIDVKASDLHKANWDIQKHLFTWPRNSEDLKAIERLNLKFGDPIPNSSVAFAQLRDQYSEVYLPEYSTLKKGAVGPGQGMADKVAPTQFRGGWQSILRHVNEFGQNALTKDQVWLLMEDIWVQRSLLSAISSVNSEMATFRRAKRNAQGEIVYDPSYDAQGNKIELDNNGQPRRDRRGNSIVIPTPEEEKGADKGPALFRNRIWAIELRIEREGNAQKLSGKLINLTDRLQLMGVNSIMKLNVYFTRDPAEQPMVFKIGGESLPGVGEKKLVRLDGKKEQEVPANELPIVFTPEHIIPATLTAREIVRVEQVFDTRTVPVKRIDALIVGHKYALDSSRADKELVPAPAFEKDPEPGSGTTGAEGSGDNPAPKGPSGAVGPIGPVGPIGTGGPGGYGSVPGPGMQQPRIGLPMGGGPIAQVIDANKKRYLTANNEVRRLPVAIMLIVDQEYIPDIIMAFANSPLQFQMTQVLWNRFRDKLEGIGPTASSGSLGGGVVYAPGTSTLGTLGYEGDFDKGPRALPTSPQPINPIGIGPVSPIAIPPGGPGIGPGSGPGRDPYGGSFTDPNAPYGSTSGLPTVTDSQITAGLVELTIYGIVSLYEKYPEPKVEPKEDQPNTEQPQKKTTPPPVPDATVPEEKND
ncbi:MAG: hypothetical protein RMJ56_17485 [Gemmataceae bacterium]|nr:hypothetical protein [Gemmata sp.]MDW8199390.1 hypothetical protein [Gemmataceae bacterium]